VSNRLNNSSRERSAAARLLEGELLFPVLMSDEQIERIGCVTQRGKNGLDGNVSENVVRQDVAADAGGRMPPSVQRKLLHAVQTAGGLLARTGAVWIRFWCKGHGCSWG
jgi:hypothetical protein